MQKLETSVECPTCKRTIKVRVEDMRPGNTKACPCGNTISFTGNDGRKAQRAMDDLQKTLRKGVSK